MPAEAAVAESCGPSRKPRALPRGKPGSSCPRLLLACLTFGGAALPSPVAAPPVCAPGQYQAFRSCAGALANRHGGASSGLTALTISSRSAKCEPRAATFGMPTVVVVVSIKDDREQGYPPSLS
jgi:hypothetical protein